MKKNDWYTLYLGNGAKVYAYLENKEDGTPNVPPVPGAQVSQVKKGFDFSARFEAHTNRWLGGEKPKPVKMADCIPHPATKPYLYQCITAYAMGQLGPRNLKLELRHEQGDDEVWIHPRYLADFWSRVIASEIKQVRKHEKAKASISKTTPVGESVI